MRQGKLTLQTALGAHVIDIEVPETAREQQAGLMFRQSVPEMTGMLFLYPRSQEVTMWMKDTRVSLDMVFIKADGGVHRVEMHTEPLSQTIIPSRGDVAAVLELAAGAARGLGCSLAIVRCIPRSRPQNQMSCPPGVGRVAIRRQFRWRDRPSTGLAAVSPRHRCPPGSAPACRVRAHRCGCPARRVRRPSACLDSGWRQLAP